MMTAHAFKENSVKPSRRVRKQRVPEEEKLARLIGLPSYRPGQFQAVDVANRAEEDQRKMVRSKETRTVRRRSHVELLKSQLNLDERETFACAWYADMHSARYDTSQITASYGDSGRSSKDNFDHLPRTPEQDAAGEDFRIAREGISPPLRNMFDRIVLGGWVVSPGIITLFRMAARQLSATLERNFGL